MGRPSKNLSRRRTGTPRKQALNKCSTSRKVDDFVYIDLDSEFPEVIVIDNPVSEPKRLKHPSPRTVINIDDDDDDEVTGRVFSNDEDSVSGSGCSAKPANSPIFAEENDKSSSFLGDRNSPVNFSKQRQNYSGEKRSRGRYGLGPESETEGGSNKSDCSDCECMEGPYEKLREQWEMASERRKTAARTNAVNPDSRHPFHSGGNAPNKSYVSDEPSSSRVEKDDRRTNCPNNDEKSYPSDDVATAFPDLGPSTANIKESLGSMYVDLDTMTATEPCSFNCQPSFDEHFNCSTEEHRMKKDPIVSRSKAKLSSDVDCERNDNAFIKANEEHTSGSCSTPLNNRPSSASFRNPNSDNVEHVVEEKDGDCQEPVISVCNHQKPETDHTFCSSVPMEIDGSTCDAFDGLKVHTTDAVPEDLVGKPCKNDIIIDRQSIKETDEYKRAMEEEWASRQQQLQIQGEEAQRLRRRKRAEGLRIMDVERRQKQRLEEVRETQRKGEADLNMKEHLRTGIRKKLIAVEESCEDMASILRKLGLPVSPQPSQNEVQTAYKKALLKFHPDRASRTDIRQQVEAEEKFKLISRMREKFPIT